MQNGARDAPPPHRFSCCLRDISLGGYAPLLRMEGGTAKAGPLGAVGIVLNGGGIFFSSCRSVRDLDDLLFGRSRRRQPLAESLHRAADDRLGEFGVVARHVGVRVSENFGQYVDGHSIFDGHAGEGVAGAMGG